MKVVINVKRDQARDIIKAQNGKFFTVLFKSKKDGHNCILNGRTGVWRYSKGGKNNVKGKIDLVSAFNVKKMDYRTINLDGVVEIRANGVIYKF